MFFAFNIDVDGILRSLWASLCQLIYRLVAFLYELFINVAGVKLLSESYIKPIYQRVTLILAIIMVFYVTLEVVKYVVQPDRMTDKEKGASNIVKKMIIVVLLIAFVPMIFEKAYDLQNTLLKNQVFSKVILGRQNVNMEKLGREFSAQMFGMFYYYDDEFWSEHGKTADEMKCDGAICATVVQMNLSTLATEGTLPYIHMGLNDKTDVDPGKGNKQSVRRITFDGLLAVAVGGFIAYILLMYCVDVGVRLAYLTFLQVIAPIPIIGYLSPKKDGIFQNWVKQCVKTYLDLFIRLAIICFILLVVEVLGNAYHDSVLLTGIGNVSRTMKTFIYVAVVLGLLLFAQKAPKMLQELFPKLGSASGSFGLKPGDRFKAAGRVVGMGAGAAVGAAAGLGTGIAQGIRRGKAAKDKGRKGFGQAMAGIGGGLMGAARGTTGGFFRGAANGVKKGNVVKNSVAGAKKQIADNKKFGNRQENGYSVFNQVGDQARNVLGLKSRIEAKEKEKNPIKAQNDTFQKTQQFRSDYRKRAESKIREGEGSLSGSVLEAEKKVRDFKEDPNVKARYTATKYREQEKADAAYSSAVSAAKNAVNKDKYKKFDIENYQRARHEAEAAVNRGDYKVGSYKTQAEAAAAYSSAVAAAKNAVNKDKYKEVDMEEYQRARDKAVMSVDQHAFSVGKYKTQAEADNAYNVAVQQAQKNVDKRKYTDANGNVDIAAYNREMVAAQFSVDKSKFTVGKYATQAEAVAAYNSAVSAAANTVKMNDYTKNNEEAYNEALENAANSVDKSKFTVGKYATEAEATAAYNNAVKAAGDEVDMSKYTVYDEEAYNEALENAANSVDKSQFTVGKYATDDEAKEAYEKDYQKAQFEATQAMEDAIFDYVNNGAVERDKDGNVVLNADRSVKYKDSEKGDGAIASMRETLLAQIEAYNKNAPRNSDPEKDRRISEEIINNIKNMSAKDLDNFIKNDIKRYIDKNELDIIRIDGEIAKIKGQMEGSGVGEGKK